MRFVCLAITVIATIALLSTVYAAVPQSVSRPSDGDYRPIATEGCGYNWHWVSGYMTIDGKNVAGHCQLDN